VSERASRLGREGSIEALVAAARELFAERGPASVSLRDVARRAGVNHGLIHHYIGSRDDLLQLTFATITDRARVVAADAEDPVDALHRLRAIGGDDDAYARLLGWVLLEGYDPAQFHGRSAALDVVVAASGVDTRELRILLAMAMIQTLGWKLFGEYARLAAGLGDEDPDDVRRDLDALVDRLFARVTTSAP
jgi:TetR/AcrR family transcriptional regulator, repressor for neighboring sulfatase